MRLLRLISFLLLVCGVAQAQDTFQRNDNGATTVCGTDQDPCVGAVDSKGRLFISPLGTPQPVIISGSGLSELSPAPRATVLATAVPTAWTTPISTPPATPGYYSSITACNLTEQMAEASCDPVATAIPTGILFLPPGGCRDVALAQNGKKCSNPVRIKRPGTLPTQSDIEVDGY